MGIVGKNSSCVGKNSEVCNVRIENVYNGE